MIERQRTLEDELKAKAEQRKAQQIGNLKARMIQRRKKQLDDLREKHEREKMKVWDLLFIQYLINYMYFLI